MYLLISVNGFLNFRQAMTGNISIDASFYASIYGLAIVIVYLVTLALIYLPNPSKWNKLKFQRQFGQFYEDLDTSEDSRLVFIIPFV